MIRFLLLFQLSFGLFRFRINSESMKLQTFNRTRWKGARPTRKPVPTQDKTTDTEQRETHSSLERDSNPPCQCSNHQSPEANNYYLYCNMCDKRGHGPSETPQLVFWKVNSPYFTVWPIAAQHCYSSHTQRSAGVVFSSLWHLERHLIEEHNCSAGRV